MTRIEHPDKHSSHLTLWLGLLAAVGVGVGAFYYMHAQAENKAAQRTGYLKPVPGDAELRRTLNREQYHGMREGGTDRAFQNMYWNNLRAGLYADFITGEPLFSSLDKYDAGTGVLSFTQPMSKDRLAFREDTSFDMKRTEVRTILSDSHLGHVFNDGPPPTGQRYSVNSSAFHFVPVEKMKEEGYGEFLPLFRPPGPDTQPTPAGK
jgi:methionine-R-sulfoxide reductase